MDSLVYVYGTRSKVHVAVRHDGEVLTPERCNLDDVVGERVVADSLDDVPDTVDMCGRCFPRAVSQSDPDTATA